MQERTLLVCLPFAPEYRELRLIQGARPYLSPLVPQHRHPYPAGGNRYYNNYKTTKHNESHIKTVGAMSPGGSRDPWHALKSKLSLLNPFDRAEKLKFTGGPAGPVIPGGPDGPVGPMMPAPPQPFPDPTSKSSSSTERNNNRHVSGGR